MTKAEAIEMLLKIKQEQFAEKQNEVNDMASTYAVAQVEEEMCEVLAERSSKYRKEFRERLVTLDTTIKGLGKKLDEKEASLWMLEEEVEYLEELVKRISK